MLYLSVKQKIENMIEDGILKEGDKLPSEPILAKELNVSRSTLREAIKLLQIQGLLISKNGIGTYVQKNRALMSNSLNLLQGTNSMIEHSGIKPAEAEVNIYELDMIEEWKEKLNCDGKAIIIERIRKSNEIKAAYTFNIFPHNIAKDFFKDGISGSLLSFLKEKMNINISYAFSEICIPNDSEVFYKKAVSQLGEKTILLKQLHFDINDLPIFYSYDYMDNNYVKFYVKRDNNY
ncbi:GntR family transcriptional regulator [Clostridium hydrogenum]|uniref:GntR family transcriptional regulator n=1 Tax=Clostridium hydrogenum TaxID=2855764 RepID=UPI001F429A87|nr:GntR family transcriptional regulator [Clostridium hydrogenum]